MIILLDEQQQLQAELERLEDRLEHTRDREAMLEAIKTIEGRLATLQALTH